MPDCENVIRWGVVGCGQIAVDKSLPGLLSAKRAKLVAIADPLEPRCALTLDLAKQAGLKSVRSYADAAGLFANADVDSVYICLPTGQHAAAVSTAAESKKAILCEKPLGRSAAEVCRMIQAAKHAGVPLMTAYMSRFGDVFQEAKRLLAENRIGQVTFVSANFSYTCLVPYPPGKPGGWRWTDAEGGGPCLDIGVYLAFGIREMLDDRIARVGACQVNTIAPKDVPTHDTTMAWFQTAEGVPGTFVTTFSHNECVITFYGTEGRLDVHGCFSQKPGGRLECHAGNFHYIGDLSHWNRTCRRLMSLSTTRLRFRTFAGFSPSERARRMKTRFHTETPYVAVHFGDHVHLPDRNSHRPRGPRHAFTPANVSFE